MKRVLSMILCLCLLSAFLVACGDKEEASAQTKAFCVGYGQADISPRTSVYLRGYGDPVAERMSTGVAEPLMLNCIAFTDEEDNTILFMSLDLLLSYKAFAKPIRQQVADATGVPFDQVMLHCTHNHCGPDPGDVLYSKLVQEAAVEAATVAMADRKPATMSTGFSRHDKVNFVRHYLLTDGSYMGEGVGSVPRSQLVGHTDAPDNLLQVVKFDREGGKPVVLINWQGHPMGSSPNPHTVATSNYPGVLRATVEKEMDCHSLFVLGGSGNMNNSSQINEENQYEDYIALGKGLGQKVIDTLATLEPAETGKLHIARKDYSYTDAVVPLYAFSVGDLAFVTAPFEIFSTNAVAVREASQFKMTFYASCSNESHGYLATPESYSYFAYESGSNPMGVAEEVEEELKKLIGQVFTESGRTPAQWKDGYHTPEFVPVTDGVVYTNPAAGDTSAYTAVKNDFYQIQLICDGKLKTMLTDSEDLAKQVLAKDTMKLLFNEQNVIVGIAE